MKKVYSFVMVSIIALTANAQLVFLENFSGIPNGNLGTQNSWVQSGAGTDVQIANTTPLVYPNYTSGTQYATVGAVTGTDPHKVFTSAINTSTDLTVDLSFVVRVASAPASNGSPAYSVALYNTLDANRPLRFYISTVPGNTNAVRFGLLTGNSTNVNNIVWTPTNAGFTTNTTYLIVIRYDNSTAPGNNDNAYLWVNPSTASEPGTGTANTQILGANEANYGAILNAIELNQSSAASSPSAAFDAFRIAYGTTPAIAWFNLNPAGATLPVTLTSFNAADDGLSTKLSWNVIEETNFASYVIEKSTDGRSFTAIGTVKATSQKAYSFIDGSGSDNNSYYRLKMVDIDGAYRYSYIVSIKSKLNANISLSPNPVKNNLMIQHPKVITEGHIQVISANGQLLRDVKLATNAVISNVDMSGFTSGLYHIVFKSGSDIFSRMVIKQ